MRALCLILFLAVCGHTAYAQFAPQAGVAGSTAIHSGSSQFVGWATGCSVRRGFQEIDSPTKGLATAGISGAGIGIADGSIVSLGDSGVAVLTFASRITDGPGADFAVFENGFANPSNPEEAFLELAFVEVSSDGVHFTRFPAASNTQDTTQIAAAGDYLNARRINNLAGKYIGGWGTPFDLAELAGTSGLDIHAITHVRLVDVIGSIGRHASLDASGHTINDPFPTPFAGSGFDLDAIGVLHQQSLEVAAGAASKEWNVYPNPASDAVIIEAEEAGGNSTVELFDVTGRMIQSSVLTTGKVCFRLGDSTPGLYFIRIISQNGIVCTKPFLHR